MNIEINLKEYQTIYTALVFLHNENKQAAEAFLSVGDRTQADKETERATHVHQLLQKIVNTKMR